MIDSGSDARRALPAADPAAEPCSDPDCDLRSDPAAHCWVEPVLHCHRPVGASSFGDLYRRDCTECQVLVNTRHRARGRRRSDAITWTVMDRLGREVEESARTLDETHRLLRTTLGELYRFLGDTMASADEGGARPTLGGAVAQVLKGLMNSLVVIGANARRLLSGEDPSTGALESTQSILDEVGHLEEIVGSLLAQNGVCGHRTEPVDPGELADRAAQRERDGFERSGVELIESRDEALPEILVDHDRVLLVVRTILQNARDATPCGGEVRLRTLRRDSRLVFEITDSGPGMPDDRKDRACEAGYTTKDAGTGLGLWLAHRVLERHGGTVNLADAEGGGLSVSLGLPIRG